MKKKTLILSLLLLVLLATAIGGGWYGVQQFSRSPLTLREETYFTLPVGTGREGLERLLIEKSLIPDTLFFPWLLRIEPELAKFKAGTYRLPLGMTVREMLELLASGKEAQFSIRFVEGSRLRDWLETLQASPYLTQTLQDKTPAEIAEKLGLGATPHPEGWFYPDTYWYTAGTTDRDLLLRAYQKMRSTLDQIWQDRQSDLPYQTPAALLTMASIVEKETAVKDERPQVASVFINRLRTGMRLQTDPTVIYGMGDNYRGAITRSALDTATPYNTYVIAGLPPTPIAMPGRASLDAAAHPAKTNYLYFVADGKGGHRFSTNLADHNRAVRDYRSTLKERDGQ